MLIRVTTILDESISVGDRVRVRSSVKKPRYEWGPIKPDSVGFVKRIDDDGDVFVKFPKYPFWRGLLSEMELVAGKLNF